MMFRNIFFNVFFCVILFSLLSCKKDKYEWSPDITAPAHYPAGGAIVQFFYKGSVLGGASSNTAISGGWGKGGGSFTSGEEKKPVPDSISVSWDCAAEEIIYQGGAKLPREKMLELFCNGYMSSTRNRYKPKKETFAYITAGMAPGGNVTVWLNTHDPDRSMDVEIMRFKANKIGVSDTSQSITLHTSTGEEAKTILKYISVHGIPKKVWEKPEDLYAYNLGYSYEENDMEINMLNLYSKAGTAYQDITNFWDINTEVPWLKPNVSTTVLHRNLPVHIIASWWKKNTHPIKWFKTDIVLPTDFEARFSAGYINASTGKKEAYRELVIGVEKGGEYGRIWLGGKNRILQVMRFKAKLGKIDDSHSVNSGGYAEEVVYYPKY